MEMLTEEVTKKVANTLKEGYATRGASIADRIAEQTYYNWHKKGKEVLQKQDEKD